MLPKWMREREREREEKKILVIIYASQIWEREKKNLLQVLLSKLHPSINGLISLIWKPVLGSSLFFKETTSGYGLGICGPFMNGSSNLIN